MNFCLLYQDVACVCRMCPITSRDKRKEDLATLWGLVLCSHVKVFPTFLLLHAP
jgi:uncharacterized paraquat-inducible protein A